MNAIEINNLTKSYGDFTLENISFSLPMGSIMGLIGENGAGKSTTIKLIMNSISADHGTVSVLNTSNQSKEFSVLKQDIGVVLDEAYFPEVLNAQNINKIMKETYINWSEEIYFGYLERFHLPLDKKLKDYSRGMKMKLSIAVALSHKPRLLILDEATSGLDPMIRDEILDIFNDFTRDETHSVLLSSHIISDLEKICDYIVFIHKGRLVMCEEKDVILNQYAIIKITQDDFECLPANAIVSKKKTSFGYEVLIIKKELHDSFNVEKTTLEDIILFMTKEDNR
ncbi:MAG: ABC transporter ATP-binding protein [Lachnospiraceae bacterium]